MGQIASSSATSNVAAHLNRFRVCLVVVFLMALASGAPESASAANQIAFFKFQSVGYLTPAADGRVWFVGQKPTAQFASLYVASSSGVVQRVQLPGFKTARSHIATIGVGPDRRIWVAATGIGSTYRTEVYRIGNHGVVATRTMPRGKRVTAFAADTRGNMWFLGDSHKTVGYFDRGLKIHGVRVPGASAMTDIVRGPDGAIWGPSDSSITRITSSRHVKTFPTSPLPTADIASGGGYLWLPGVGGAQRVSVSGEVRLVPLVYPTFVQSNASDHVDYPFTPNRLVLSVFPERGVAIGLTSGTLTESDGGTGTDFASLGNVDTSGRLGETPPLTPGPVWYANDDLSGQAASSAQLATADKRGNVWVALYNGLSVYRLP